MHLQRLDTDWINFFFLYSHLVSIPPGPHILSDMLMSTPIIAGEDGAPGNFSSGGAGGDFEFGIDPNLDPELALVRGQSDIKKQW